MFLYIHISIINYNISNYNNKVRIIIKARDVRVRQRMVHLRGLSTKSMTDKTLRNSYSVIINLF